MSALCETCKSRTYCFMLNFRIFQSLGFTFNLDKCPLYECDPSCIQGDDQPEDESRQPEQGYTLDNEETFEINAEITVQCRMKEFELNAIKPKSCDHLKRLSIMIDRESLQSELRKIINREIRNKLGSQCKDSVMREDAKTNIEVPLIFSNWILN